MPRDTVLAIALLVGLVGSVTAADPMPPDLSGTYDVKVLEKSGKPATAEGLKAISGVVIAKGKFTITVDKVEKVAAIKFDMGKKPAGFDLLPEGGDDKNKRFRGIFKVEKDELTIVYNEEGDAPKEFKSDGPSITLIVLKKK